MIYDLLKKLIEKKFYENKADIQKKLDVFYAMSKITDEEYTELTLLVESNYSPVIEEETIETL